MGFVELQQQPWLLAIAHFGELLVQRREQPEQHCGEELRGAVELGTPMRLNCSTTRCTLTVLPVPGALAIRRRRLAFAGSSTPSAPPRPGSGLAISSGSAAIAAAALWTAAQGR
ncbi:hypothetical protein NZK33_04270 [Cyanobium sp. FGCU-6]|nr:hypothetical protein [Cyanobium sp. FGCU6]